MSAKIYSMVSRIMGVPIVEINDDSGPETIERWDSFQGLVLLDDLETTFGVKFTLEEVLNMKTIGDIKRNLSIRGITLDG